MLVQVNILQFKEIPFTDKNCCSKHPACLVSTNRALSIGSDWPDTSLMLIELTNVQLNKLRTVRIIGAGVVRNLEFAYGYI